MIDSDVEELIKKLEDQASVFEQKVDNENRLWEKADEIEEWKTRALLLRAEAMKLRLELGRNKRV